MRGHDEDVYSVRERVLFCLEQRLLRHIILPKAVLLRIRFRMSIRILGLESEIYFPI